MITLGLMRYRGNDEMKLGCLLMMAVLLLTACTRTVCVSDPSGRPIQGAEVVAIGTTTLKVVESDDQGKAHLPASYTDTPSHLMVQKGGYEPRILDYPSSWPAQITLRLEQDIDARQLRHELADQPTVRTPSSATNTAAAPEPSEKAQRLIELLSTEDMESILFEWPTAEPPSIRRLEQVLVPGPQNIAYDGFRYLLFLDASSGCFWIMKSGGFIGTTTWKGPAVLTEDGRIRFHPKAEEE